MKVVFGLTAAAALGSAASVALAPACFWAIPAGLAATLLYTPLAKPCALGELLVYLVWGPAMVGGGYAATAGVHSPSRYVARFNAPWTRGVRDDLRQAHRQNRRAGPDAS